MNRQELEEKTNELEETLLRDRDKWSNKIRELISMMKNVNDIPEAQVFMLSYRQMLLDSISSFQSSLYKKNVSFDTYYKNKFREYTLDYDIKLNGGEKEKMIRSDLTLIQRQINLLESHIDYYRECIRTLDNMGFAIRNRIRVAEEF
jgi:predicted component of viral defense system (DUF524 family)